MIEGNEKIIKAEIEYRDGSKKEIDFTDWGEYSDYLDNHLGEIENAHGEMEWEETVHERLDAD